MWETADSLYKYYTGQLPWVCLVYNVSETGSVFMIRWEAGVNDQLGPLEGYNDWCSDWD